MEDKKRMILLMSLAGYWLNKDNQVTDGSVGTITLADEIDSRRPLIISNQSIKERERREWEREKEGARERSSCKQKNSFICFESETKIWRSLMINLQRKFWILFNPTLTNSFKDDL